MLRWEEGLGFLFVFNIPRSIKPDGRLLNNPFDESASGKLVFEKDYKTWSESKLYVLMASKLLS